ncbi:TPA: hypothetical protein MIO78_18465 [Klebsiella pneumoniae subsp. pneumoniae]|nr:hypothetical protein [Klebsiella pneumoniae subsp. pneumoniae]HBY0669841.1 hypothetical protein [Klebsiella pneumoniae subsp. pneumoniae]
MTLWTDSYQSSIDSISNYIENNFTPYNDIPDNLFQLDDSVLADCIIVVAWRYFREGANKRGNSSRLTQSFHFFMFEPIFSPVNALNQPI